MLRVTVELIPYGREEDAQILQVLEIWNDGTGSSTVGNYEFGYPDVNGHRRFKGEVKNHPRLDVSVWNLVWKVLAQRYGKETSA